jgi:hypothetical protein
MIHVALDNDRVVVILDVNRPGRRIMLVAMVALLFVMAIGMAAGIPAGLIRQGHTGTDEQDKRNNR